LLPLVDNDPVEELLLAPPLGDDDSADATESGVCCPPVWW
jgi:hypothetical protein